MHVWRMSLRRTKSTIISWHGSAYMDRVKRIWYLSPMRAAKVQASLRIRAVSPEPSLLAHTSSESRGTFRQKARSLAPLNGWACAVKICHDGMLEDTNSFDGAHMLVLFFPALWSPQRRGSWSLYWLSTCVSTCCILIFYYTSSSCAKRAHRCDLWLRHFLEIFSLFSLLLFSKISFSVFLQKIFAQVTAKETCKSKRQRLD